LNTLEIPITIDLPTAGDGSLAPPDHQFPRTANPSTTDDWDNDLESTVQNAVIAAAQSQGFASGRIGVMITDDDTIHEINRRYLDHDYPTDVISFTYDRSGSMVEGELVVSLCTARRSAAELGWDWRHELLLYVVHGTLHICGLEDSSAAERAEMRSHEQAVLGRLGITDARHYSPDLDQEFSAERS
jgi:probable rRNA maturation factor